MATTKAETRTEPQPVKTESRTTVEQRPIADNTPGVQMDPGSLTREGTTFVQTPDTGEAIGASNIGGDNPSTVVLNHAEEMGAAMADLRNAERRLQQLKTHYEDRHNREERKDELADVTKRLAAVEKAARTS